MEIRDFVSSGIIEMYCMGLASEEERMLVEKLASENKEVQDEINSVNEALSNFAIARGKSPAASLKNKIIDSVLNSQNRESVIGFPPAITSDSTVEEWMKYISDNKISASDNYAEFCVIDLPGNKNQSTYIAWAKKGAILEESHESEDEYLLMLKGKCSVTINGKKEYYKEGDLIFIPKNSLHCAEALSDEPMILVGQRIAA